MGTVPMGCILSLRTVLAIVLTEFNNIIFIQFESNLKLLSYGQLSPGAVVTWAFVFLIRANFVASWVVLPDENNFVFIPFELNLKLQLSLGAVVAWAAVPPIRGSLVASLIVLI